MKLRKRTKAEQKAYLEGFKRCAECVKKYLSVKGKNILYCQLMAVSNAVEDEGDSNEQRRQTINM